MTIIKNITSSEAQKLIENDKYTIVDVRMPYEFDKGHIQSARNLDFTDPDFTKNLEKLDKNEKYIIYCKTGRRGALALEVFKNAGFRNVYNIIGGYDAWEENNDNLLIR